MKRTVKVVAAIIENKDNEILCALRSPNMTLPNMWEFPGGKVEKNENIYEAVVREVKEELGCSVVAKALFHENIHEYETFFIHLLCIKCTIIVGQPIIREHSKFIWMKRENLCSLLWAPADIPAVEKLMIEK